MPGAYATNPHTAFRSEILADYLFTTWGTVTPVRVQDDHGVDLYGGLAESRGKRSVVTDYYVVQVKSVLDPWVFADVEAVRWLIEYPLPLFLACVDKPSVTVAVYHVTPRFYLAAMGEPPAQLTLVPGEGTTGAFVSWGEDGGTFSLSAPILRVGIADFLNPEVMASLRAVFAHWIRVDRENLDLLRMGLLRFRMPQSYQTNQIPPGAIGEVGNARPASRYLQQGMLTLAEVVECVGGQLGETGDRESGLLAALLLHHVLRAHATPFAGHYRWRAGIPSGALSSTLSALNDLMPAMSSSPNAPYVFRGLEEVAKQLAAGELMKAFLAMK